MNMAGRRGKFWAFRKPFHSLLPLFQARKREDSGWAGRQLFESCSVTLQWSSWPSSAAAPGGAAPRAAAGTPRVLATATATAARALVSASKRSAKLVVAQAAASTPRAAAAPGAGGTAGRHWRGTRGWALGRTLRGTLGWAFGGTLGRGLALLLVLLAGHLGRNWMELEENREILSSTNAR